MKKIPTIFKRNPENMKELLNIPHKDCHWVFSGEGVATKKYDGTCCKIQDGKFFKRREVKKGKEVPDGFVEENFDEGTGKRVGWVWVDPELKENKYHVLAFSETLEDGTYELVGPKIQGGAEYYGMYHLIRHEDAAIYSDLKPEMRTFDGLKKFLEKENTEGIVFHHPDGRMAKIKKRDFGLKRVP